MKKTMRRLFGSLLCLALLVCLVPTAWAVGDADAAAYETRLYGKDIIVGFESPDPPVIDTAYKYALIELRKEFPVRLNALMGGTAFYERDEDGTLSIHHVDAASTQEIDVGWKCLEDYDEDLDVFHFVPVLDEKKSQRPMRATTDSASWRSWTKGRAATRSIRTAEQTRLERYPVPEEGTGYCFLVNSAALRRTPYLS